ncbi:MAG: T9SS C-terminal target domain-containing protein [Bacteroidetes bacterium]|nr:MAG: T9SS C-terminal target domain-containing protein [Bacteroidota bacterium]
MKKIFTLLAMCSLVWGVQAQLPSGTIAPDFTTTDLDGNEFNLYDKLDEGYTVILDFSATWCGPCWAYAQAGHLDRVWEEYGPDGTQEVYVIKIEGDASTDLADLQGTGDRTQGNWLSVISHPIADDASMTQLYNINYWPTIYTVCPNRIITETGRLTADGHYAFANTCLRAEGEVNAGLLLYEGLQDPFCGEADLNPTITLQNLGAENLTSASVELNINGQLAQTIDWSGDLATYELETINFDDITITETTEANFNILSINGVADTINDANSFTAVAPRAGVTDQNEAILTITTDEYAVETYWELLDGNGNPLYTGGNIGIFDNPPVVAEGSYENSTSYEIPITLPADGCFEIKVYDYAGDGMCCAFGEGGYTLVANGEIIASGGEFTDEVSTPFELSGANTITSNAQIVQYLGEDAVACGASEYEASMFVQNLGATDITSIDFSVSTDGGATSDVVTWMGSITPGNFATVSIDIPVDGDLDLVITILNVNGEADTYDFQNSIATSVRSETPTATNRVEFSLHTDFWPEEISWELRNSSGELIDSDANYPELTCDADFMVTFDLELNECYEFTISDSFGDGLFVGPANPASHSCDTPGGQESVAAGAISLSSAQGVLFDEVEYGDGATIEFVVTERVVSTQEVEALEGMTLFPNPVSDQLTVRLDLKEASSLNVQVFNSIGQMVQQVAAQQFGAGSQQLVVDAKQLQSGVYFLRVQDGEQLTTRRFLVQR